MNFNDLVTRIFNPKQINKPMKNEKLSALLGRTVNVGDVLSPEDMQTVINALPDPTPAQAGTVPSVEPVAENPTETTQEETANPSPDANTEMMNAIQELTSTVNTLSQTVSGISDRLNIVEGKPANETVTAPLANGTENAGSDKLSLDSPEHPLNKLAAKELGA